jgi:3-oxoacyl-[acyl-carrier-protein] synthase II
MSSGASAIKRIEVFDPSGFESKHAGFLPPDAFKVRDYVPKSYRKATKVMARDIELAVGAAAEAIRHAGIFTKASEGEEPTISPARMGCHIGAGLIAADVDELTAALVKSCDEDGAFDIGEWGRAGMGNLTPLWLLKYLPNMLACHVTIIHDCQGPSNTITCAESSGTLSIGESMRVIRRGAADACLSGGCDSKVNPMAFLRQELAGRLVSSDDDAEANSLVKPFADDAAGAYVGEGGGIMVLEAHETALARGATPLVELAGFAATQSVCPDTVGRVFADDDESVADAIRFALADAGMEPDDIDGVIPFGSGIPAMDRADRSAIESVFGERASDLPLVMPIPYVGNCGAGAGGISIAVAARCIQEQKIPARINTQGVEGLNANASECEETSIRAMVVFTTSLGGHNAAVVLRRIEGEG